MHPTLSAALAAALVALAAVPAAAQQKGSMTLGIGLAGVAPKSGNGTLSPGSVDVGNNVQPSLTFEYFIADNLGIEVLAATPFKHNVSVGGTRIGSVRHLPPTLTLQYHFPTGSSITPFVGAGITYVTFFKEDTVDVLESNVKLKDSWGLSLHAGVDFALNDKAALRTDVRWMDVDSKVSLNGAPLGTVNIDPVVLGVSYIIKF